MTRRSWWNAATWKTNIVTVAVLVFGCTQAPEEIGAKIKRECTSAVTAAVEASEWPRGLGDELERRNVALPDWTEADRADPAAAWKAFRARSPATDAAWQAARQRELAERVSACIDTHARKFEEGVTRR